MRGTGEREARGRAEGKEEVRERARGRGAQREGGRSKEGKEEGVAVVGTLKVDAVGLAERSSGSDA